MNPFSEQKSPIFFEHPLPPTLRACGLGLPLLTQEWKSESGLTKHHIPQPVPWLPSPTTAHPHLVLQKAHDPSPSNLRLLKTSLNLVTTTSPVSCIKPGPSDRIRKKIQQPDGGRHAESCPQEPPVGEMAFTMVTAVYSTGILEWCQQTVCAQMWLCTGISQLDGHFH